MIIDLPLARILINSFPVFREKLAAEREAFEKHKEAELSEIETMLKSLGIDEMKSAKQVWCRECNVGFCCAIPYPSEV